MQLNHLDIMKMAYENERKRVLDRAGELARELESSAKLIAKAVEHGDLTRITWLLRTHDVLAIDGAVLATRVDVLRENLQLIASFATNEDK